ncbi:NUDIX hydrolase [Legionella waltersii]|uniref:MutT/nudix family transporter protein n=1 Tax=Legionella waltersii TaxID=66969 RepID=A0A0W1A0Z9_9GAMM|nr:CoA pyrophosphatase [Legionella waltersii]KTD75041.1 MutT/nudix family transporter protein [Legionella waltersii]SNV05407.1 MutT/nudix family transporter protein [Legionella waltersii]
MQSIQLDDDHAQSSVIVLHDLSTNSIVLTKRSEHLKNHPGEICFPGGFRELDDENLLDTALRELNEELSITADRVTLIKEMQVETTLLGAVIHPWLASIESIVPYRINPSEVSAVISVSMDLATNMNNYKKLTIVRNGIQFESWEFIQNKEVIWGATARIMKQLATSV